MSMLKSFAIALMIACFAPLLLLGCNDAESVADDTDGDSPDTGVRIGGACSASDDCPDESSCMPVPVSGRICTKTCTADGECSQFFAGGCCMKIGTTWYCAPAIACEGDEPDGEEPDGETPEDGDDAACTPDEYHCRDNRTVERCGNDGTWSVYKTCLEGTNCRRGSCVLGAPECDDSTFCCPDTYRCYHNDIQKCSGSGEDWEYYRTCEDDEICVDGICNPLDISDGDVPEDGDVDGDTDPEEPVLTPCTMDEGCDNDLEYCLPEEPGGDEGFCRLYCDQPTGTCPRGYRCVQGTCQMVDGYCLSDAQCDMDEFCDKRPGAEDGLCYKYCNVMGEICPMHSYCDENPSSINYGKCVWEECRTCSFDEQCVTGQYCDVPLGQIEGCCMEMCGPTNPCPGAMECQPDGRCGVGDGMGDCGGFCPAGFVCDPLYNQCALNCPPCGPQECCDAGSAPNCYVCECTNPIVCGWGLKSCCFGYSCSAIVYGVIGFCI